MSKITILSAALVAAFAAPAFAQTVEVEPVPEMLGAIDTHFTSADIDQDGALSADEFVTYAVMKAEDGDEAMRTLVVSGDYDRAFADHDTDASATLTPNELVKETADETMSDGFEPLEMEIKPETEEF